MTGRVLQKQNPESKKHHAALSVVHLNPWQFKGGVK